MWEILFGYALEKIFQCDRDAFEVGDTIVQTESSEDVSSPSISSVVVAAKPSTIVAASRNNTNRSRNNESKSRPLIQVGFNPFGPVLIYGAEQLLKHLDYETHTYDDEVY